MSCSHGEWFEFPLRAGPALTGEPENELHQCQRPEYSSLQPLLSLPPSLWSPGVHHWRLLPSELEGREVEVWRAHAGATPQQPAGQQDLDSRHLLPQREEVRGPQHDHSKQAAATSRQRHAPLHHEVRHDWQEKEVKVAGLLNSDCTILLLLDKKWTKYIVGDDSVMQIREVISSFHLVRIYFTIHQFNTTRVSPEWFQTKVLDLNGYWIRSHQVTKPISLSRTWKSLMAMDLIVALADGKT